MANQTYDALLFLLNTLFGLYCAALLLRVILQWVRADFYNPLAQFIWQITHPPLDTLKFIPRWRNLDIAALLLAWVLVLINLQLALSLSGANVSFGSVLANSVMNLMVLVLNIFTISIFVQAIMSWVNQGAHSPASSLLWSLNEPLLRPVRNFLPPIGGLDLSPLFVILALQVVRRLIPITLALY